METETWVKQIKNMYTIFYKILKNICILYFTKFTTKWTLKDEQMCNGLTNKMGEGGNRAINETNKVD